MKKEYPNYKGKGVISIKLKLPAKDINILEDFKVYIGMTAGDHKVKRVERQLLQFYDVMYVSYDEITLRILRKFLFLLNNSDKAIETQNDIKKTLKRFLKWYYKDWSNRFDELRDIKTKDGTNHQKLNASTILTSNELHIIINSIESLKYKSLILLMYESAGRPEEILKLKWRDINFDKKEVTLNSSKTRKTRVNLLNESIAHLNRYKMECFYPSPLPDDFIFPNPRNVKKHVTVSGLDDYFKKLENKLKLKKHIFPYLLRHTRLTELHKKLSPKAYEKFAGHSIDVGTKRYAHLSNDDVREEMLSKVYHIEELKEKENQIVIELENRLKRMEATIHHVIKKGNIVFDQNNLP
jgi:integrase